MGDAISASDTSWSAAGDPDLSSVWRGFGPGIGLVFRTLVLGAVGGIYSTEPLGSSMQQGL